MDFLHYAARLLEEEACRHSCAAGFDPRGLELVRVAYVLRGMSLTPTRVCTDAIDAKTAGQNCPGSGENGAKPGENGPKSEGVGGNVA